MIVMLAGKHNIVLQQGSTFDLLLTLQYPNPDYPADCQDPEDCPEYLVWDLTGYTAKMQVRKYVESASAHIELNTTNAGGYPRIVLGGVNGTIQLLIRAEDTQLITQSGNYDLEITAPNNEVDRILEGTFTVSRQVTQ